jgi:hypothetical protein
MPEEKCSLIDPMFEEELCEDYIHCRRRTIARETLSGLVHGCVVRLPMALVTNTPTMKLCTRNL